METKTQSTIPNKNKKMLIIIAIIVLVIVALVLIKSKVSAPVDVNGITDSSSGLQGDNKALSIELDSATTFDNEVDLKEIDKEFQ